MKESYTNQVENVRNGAIVKHRKHFRSRQPSSVYRHVQTQSVAVLDRGRAQAPNFAPGPPVSWPPTIFGKDNTKSDFFALPNFRKVGKFAAFVECPKTKSASASGGSCKKPRVAFGVTLENLGCLGTPI